MKLNLRCGICGKKKPTQSGRLRCLDCANRRAREWYAKNPDRAKANNKKRGAKYRSADPVKQQERVKKWQLRYDYDISLEEYRNLLELQNGVCAICKRPEFVKTKGTIRWLSVDHCHKTGKVRGLLCSKCNVGIANFRESIDALLSAIEYLRKEER